MIDSPEYQQIFKTRLREDSQAAGKWAEQGGGYYAAGVGRQSRTVVGLLIDDPHSEQDALNAAALEKAGGTPLVLVNVYSQADIVVVMTVGLQKT